MHLTLSHELLSKATDLVAKVADRHHRFVILGNIKFEARGDTLLMSASDLEVELCAALTLAQGTIQEEGATTLPAGKFHEIAKSLNKDNPVVIKTLDDERCLISSGKSKFTLSALPATDFPSIGRPAQPTLLEIERNELTQMLAKTRFCMASQDVRHYLTGMLFHVEGANLTTVATDGHRLAVSHGVLTDTHDERQLIVPGKAVVELERLLNELGKVKKDDTVTLAMDKEFLQLQANFDQGETAESLTVSMTARLIDATFPDYKRVLPTDCDKLARFPKDTMNEVIRRVSILSNEKLRGVVLEFDQGLVTVRSGASDSGEAVEQLAIEYEGEAMELSLNETYLKAVLAVLAGEVSLQMSQPNSPTLLTQTGDTKHQYVIMPMRI